jgi:hypothetical protein
LQVGNKPHVLLSCHLLNGRHNCTELFIGIWSTGLRG